MTRRRVLRCGLLCAGAVATGYLGFPPAFAGRIGSHVIPNDAPAELWKWSREGLYYKTFRKGTLCLLCPHECFMVNGDRGICRVRINKDGRLYSLVYGNPSAIHVDPVEKKPLLHFLPATAAFSIATAGCNLRCLNCQNWELSQSRPEDLRFFDLFPEGVVKQAAAAGCASVAYTYSEPSVYYEYMLESARLARARGLKNIWVTAGYINEAPLRELCGYIDAANVDLKAFTDDIYVQLNGARLAPVLNTLRILKEEGVWLEITNLVVPSWTDNFAMIRKMAEWLADNGFQDTPLHFSRFHPMFRLKNLPPTPVAVLNRAREIAMDCGIKFCYVGNVPGAEESNTICPACGKVLIRRQGYTIKEMHVKNGQCAYCGEIIAGVWR